ncbi:MAG: hypothetical protein V2J12_11680 [Gammaproteobacteria bacterium]|nr:hypothetical protein [Gammaproteobacteria bacterium]
MNAQFKNVAAITTLACALAPTASLAGDEWDVGLSIYGYFPDISGRTQFPVGAGTDFDIGIDSILDNLELTFQGNFDIRKDRLGVFTDVIYLDVGNNKSQAFDGTVGGTPLPAEAEANADVNVKALIWTTSAYYRLFEQQRGSLDLMVGVRYSDIKQQLAWNLEGSLVGIALPGRTGSRSVSTSYLDGIVGVRGRAALGDGNHWFIPYYADIGTGDSDLTWQAAAGVGYAFGWGEMSAGWRYVAYDMASGKPVRDLTLSGPQIGAAFRW